MTMINASTSPTAARCLPPVTRSARTTSGRAIVATHAATTSGAQKWDEGRGIPAAASPRTTQRRAECWSLGRKMATYR